MTKLYTAPNCQPCKATKRWLESKGVKFDELDAHAHIDYLRGLGASESPVLVHDNNIVTGFQPSKLKELFG